MQFILYNAVHNPYNDKSENLPDTLDTSAVGKGLKTVGWGSGGGNNDRWPFNAWKDWEKIKLGGELKL